MGFGAACCLASLGIFGAPSTTIAIVLISIVLFGHYFLSANMFAAISDLLPAQAVGRTTALTGIAGGISGAVFPTLTGRLVDQVSYAPVFALAAIMPLAGVLVLFLLNPKFERAGAAKS
jgi:sugar phosphate permease